MTYVNLDRELALARQAHQHPELADDVWRSLATTIHSEIAALDESTINRLRQTIMLPPERYVEELTAFQAWTEIAQSHKDNPVVVRARVMTELYVAFVWLRDSVVKPTAATLAPGSALRCVEQFLSNGQRRHLRNAIAHGRWCYLPDFTGLEYWAEPSRGQPHERYEIANSELGAWQVLSRGTAIAVLLSLTT